MNSMRSAPGHSKGYGAEEPNDKIDCPKCGKPQGNLPKHMRACDD